MALKKVIFSNSIICIRIQFYNVLGFVLFRKKIQFLNDGNCLLSTVFKLPNWEGPTNNRLVSNPVPMTPPTGLTTMSSVLVHICLLHMAQEE